MDTNTDSCCESKDFVKENQEESVVRGYVPYPLLSPKNVNVVRIHVKKSKEVDMEIQVTEINNINKDWFGCGYMSNDNSTDEKEKSKDEKQMKQLCLYKEELLYLFECGNVKCMTDNQTNIGLCNLYNLLQLHDANYRIYKMLKNKKTYFVKQVDFFPQYRKVWEATGSVFRGLFFVWKKEANAQWNSLQNRYLNKSVVSIEKCLDILQAMNFCQPTFLVVELQEQTGNARLLFLLHQAFQQLQLYFPNTQVVVAKSNCGNLQLTRVNLTTLSVDNH
ncbi:hypothetical protein RFI_26814 [Reticulomyxa filosa]|uniref:Uncharacterized protein n=1 Tax=Reticulomyxa filosa TaxID=46433 RepID=X6M9J5_RETFI|nr:hypothetical protein RFI_26814 [Reticulomyxa filosa]|eukprot:ETO10559.1 hypothetical protein RFI_26814 [Reticulomyxa filosa]